MTHRGDSSTEDGKREALLNAARDLFLKNSYANISIRKIADKAKVNSAMIAYYFGSKSGLFREMVKSYFDSNFELIRRSIGHPDQKTLEELYRNVYSSLPSELAQLMFRTVIFERSEMREWLLMNLLTPLLDIVDSYFIEMIEQGNRPETPDPAIIRTILQSTLVMPLLLYPTLKEVDPNKIPDDFFEQLARTNAAMITEYLKLEKN